MTGRQIYTGLWVWGGVIVLCAIVIGILFLNAFAETVSITIDAPTQQTVVEKQSISVTPEVVTATAEINTIGTETLTIVEPGPQGIPGATTAGEGGGYIPGQNATFGNVSTAALYVPGSGGATGDQGTSIIGQNISSGGNVTAYGNVNAGNVTANLSTGTLSGNKLSDGITWVPMAAILDIASIQRGYDGREIELQTGATHIQWRYLGDTTWLDLAPIPADGAAGANGADGAAGTDGKTVLNGSGAPGSGLGTDGDFYLDTAAANLYGPKAAGAWPETYVSLIGPEGPQGPEGPPGSINQAAVLGVLDDPTDGATLWLQQGATESATAAKSGAKDAAGNARQWIDGNGTTVRQCITADSAPAFKMLSPAGAVIYSVSCDNTMTFSGTVTIK